MSKKYTIENIDIFFEYYYIIKEILSDEDINALLLEWKSNNNINPHDFFWLLFNNVLSINGNILRDGGYKSNFYQNQNSLYHNMAHFRREEGAKKETINQFHRLAFQSVVDDAKYGDLASSVEREIIVISNTKTDFAPEYICQYGISQNQKNYSPEDFMDKCYIATDKCTRKGGCSCTLATSVKRDSEGNIISKKINISSKSNKESKGCVMVFIQIIILITIASIFTF